MKTSAYHQLARTQADHWWFIGMRQIAKTILNQFIKKKDLILDVGSGTGGDSHFLSQYGQVYHLDKSTLALKLLQSSTTNQAVLADTQFLPFKNNSFSLLTSFDVLYHAWVNSPKLALKEYFRVLKPQGLLLIRLPAYNFLFRQHDKQVMTRRRFTLKSIIQDLPKAYNILKATYANTFLLPIVLLRKFSTKTGLKPLPPILNSIFKQVLFLESKLISKTNLPFGSSIFLLIQKS